MTKNSRAQNLKSISCALFDVGRFFTNCSIRGVSKAYKTNSIVVRVLWITFIILMIILLLYSIIKIVREYLEYNTTIQTRLEIDAASVFPAITICPYQPFSHRAIDFFKQGGMSPKNFSQRLRQTALKYLERNEPANAEKFMFYDDLRVYYQNLEYKEAIKIGLNKSEIFVFCITKLKLGMFIGQISLNCGYNITMYSTPEFFNCYTINVMPEYSKATEYIMLVLRFPKPDSLDEFRETSLLKSLFQNIIGAQLLVHESHTLPPNNKEKIHIEPNRLLQINFQNHQWKEYSTPNDMCMSNPREKIDDLENKYAFTFAGCLMAYNARQVLDKCGCVIAFLPRSVIPSTRFPYCANFGNLTEEGFKLFAEKSLCIAKILKSLEKVSSVEKNCYKRCEDQRFNLQISSIKWKPSLWQLEWLFKLQESWNTLIEQVANDSRKEQAKQTAMKFLHSNSLKDLSGTDDKSLFNENERYACVVLERLSNETLYKEERLGLSLYGLVSRIGGSCTLYLGLTCAFVIEIVEFAIIGWTDKLQNKRKNREKERRENSFIANDMEFENRSVIIISENDFHDVSSQTST